MANERWRRLCEAIVAETDTQKLLSLVSQLEEELDCRDSRLQHKTVYSCTQPPPN